MENKTDKFNDKILSRVTSFLNLRQLLVLLKINKMFANKIINSDIYNKYILLKQEFCTCKDDKKKPKRLETIGAKLHKIKTTSIKKVNLIKQSTKENLNRSLEYKNEKINYDKITYSTLFENDCDKIKKINSKYSLSQEQSLSIFSGLIEASLYRDINKHSNNEFILKCASIGSGTKYLQYAFSSMNMIKKFDLSECVISHKNFKPIANIISALSSSLLLLKLHNSKLNDQSSKYLFSSLSKNNTLTYLDISKNDISSEGFLFAESFLKSTSSLHTLNLEQNLLGSKGMLLLADFLSLNSSIRTLNIAYNGIQEEGIANLSTLIAKNTKIISLFVGGNYICDKGLKNLIKYLQEGSKISYLFLDNNNITIKGAEYLAELISYHPFIRAINLKNNKLCDEGVIKIFNAIEKGTKIISIDLTNTSITNKSIDRMAIALKGKKTIGNITLNRNKLGKESCVSLGKFISTNESVIDLNLSKCDLAQGIEHLFDQLSKNITLTRIDISKNSIGKKSQSFLSIIPCLKENKFITEINFDDNGLDDTDIKVLCHAMSENHTIKKISIKSNDYSSEILPDMLTGIEKSGSLRYLEYDISKFSQVDQKQIEFTLQKNINKK